MTTTRLPDISNYYNLEKATKEDVQWLYTGQYRREAAFVLPRFERYGVKSVIELGCGSGLLATQVPAEIQYIGIDKNVHFLEKARDRNPGRRFLCWDVRNVEEGLHDCAMSFGVLKHVSLDELDSFLACVLRHGRYGAFNVQVAQECYDDGTEYHHTHITMERLKQALAVAGHEIVDMEYTAEEYDTPGHGKGRDLAVWTKRSGEEATFKAPAEIYKDVEPEPDTSHGEGDPQPSGDPAGGPSFVTRTDIEIEGVPVTEHERYVVRFVPSGEGYAAVLYKDGKRVTKAWRVCLELTGHADPSGGNANTAE